MVSIYVPTYYFFQGKQKNGPGRNQKTSGFHFRSYKFLGSWLKIMETYKLHCMIHFGCEHHMKSPCDGHFALLNRAKNAAAATRLPARLLSQFSTAGTLVRHQCALLGVVTKAANNFCCVQTDEDGSSKVTIRRDSTAERPHFGCHSSRSTDNCPAAQPPGLISDAPTPVHASTVSALPPSENENRQAISGDAVVPQQVARRRFVASVQSFKRKAEERERLDSLVAAKRLRPSSAPPAALRMAELRARVAARAYQ